MLRPGHSIKGNLKILKFDNKIGIINTFSSLKRIYENKEEQLKNDRISLRNQIPQLSQIMREKVSTA